MNEEKIDDLYCPRCKVFWDSRFNIRCDMCDGPLSNMSDQDMNNKTDTRKDKEPEYQKMLADLSTSVDWADYVKYVQTMAERRKKAGLLKDDLDFALGASTAFFYFSRQDKLPSSWIFNPLGNVSPFYDGHNKDSEFYKAQKYKEKKK